MKKISIPYLLVLIALLVSSFIIRDYQKELLSFIKTGLNSGFLFFFLTSSIFVITFLHKIRYNEINLTEISNPKKYRESLSEIISGITDPSTFICSFSILKGLILDSFFADTFFIKFNQPEKVFLFIASFYFFIVSFLEIKENFLELIRKSSEVMSSTD